MGFLPSTLRPWLTSCSMSGTGPILLGQNTPERQEAFWHTSATRTEVDDRPVRRIDVMNAIERLQHRICGKLCRRLPL